jgi:acetyl-CoA carboxylase carboxyltransferase component
MGPAGKEFVYKDELRKIRAEGAKMDRETGAAFLKAREAELNARYEKELMNPREALSLGSISRVVMPVELRAAIARAFAFYMRHYTPSTMTGPQREFH